MSECDHLLPEVRALLGKPIEERLRAIERDVYIQYPKAKEILTEMERLYTYGGSSGRLIVAPSGNGKSTIFKAFMNKHPPRSSADCEQIPVLRVETPEKAGSGRFLGAVLEAFGFDDYDRDTFERRRLRVMRELKGTGVKVILVDEVHNLLAGSPKLKEETANLLKNLSNTFDIPIVFAGTERAESVFRYDSQLVKRFPIFRLPAWRDGQAFRLLLRMLESTLPLPRPSGLGESEKANYVLKRSNGILGDIVLAEKEAARLAVLGNDSMITLDHLKRSTFRSEEAIVGPLVSPRTL